MQGTPELATKRCVPCEGKVPRLTPAEIEPLRKQVPDWSLTADGTRIRREWVVMDFAAGMDFFRRVAEVAEAEDHHPDLHLVEYRKVGIELWTHAAGGLTENDFILAAKIDTLPVEVKK
jgi:4a-hydroxytetrahydrobiopterin dehydratase